MEKSLKAPQWIRRGSMMVNRDFIKLSDPESWLSLWIKEFGDIEDFPWEEVYGIVPPEEQLAKVRLCECPLCGSVVFGDKNVF